MRRTLTPDPGMFCTAATSDQSNGVSGLDVVVGVDGWVGVGSTGVSDLDVMGVEGWVNARSGLLASFSNKEALEASSLPSGESCRI